MYLKGIEVSGFKSFARKTEFHFQDGITGIVGPNGSGKSNVADAMRWVLGEQSAKQLRSSNMQDVIFAGTENRRPQGYAYVNIVFDNSDHALPLDYDEVTIGRRVYRSGESEYLINSNACRLKDVQELFYDTGIGKEGYSIIGQGQIDKILNGKPEDRRELFDEAAGIVKFKKRKNQALNRLAKEEESLVRIRDILGELTRQEGPLKNQAEKAKAYLHYHDELRVNDVNDYLIEVEDSRKQLTKLLEDYRLSSEQLAVVRKESDGIKDRYSKLSEIFNGVNRQLDELHAQLEQSREQVSEKKAEMAVLKEQIQSETLRREMVVEQEEKLRDELGKLTSEETALSEKLQQQAGESDSADRKFERLTGQIAEIEEKLEKTEKSIREDQMQIEADTAKKSQLLVDRQKYDTLTDQARLQEAQLNGRLLQAIGQETEAKAELRKGKAAMQAEKEKISVCKTRIQEMQNTLQQLDEKLLHARKEADHARGTLHQAKARLDSVQNLAERYEGYGMSVRRLMENRKQFPGIYGVLADLIQVEKRYETAIETSLGGALQNVVTDNEQTARACIEYLKRNKAGRATFLPVTTVKARGGFTEQTALSMPGVCGTADQLVHTDDRYRDIIRFLLGRILIIDTMDHALAAASRFRYSFRIVTLEGESLNAGGSISGGAFRNNSNLLGRRREMEELEQNLAAAKACSEQAETAVELLVNEKEQKQEELSALNKQMQEEQMEFRQIEMLLRQNLDLLDSARDEKTNLEQEITELSENTIQLKRNYENVDQKADELDESMKKRQEQIHLAEEEAALFRKQLEELNQKKIAEQIEQASAYERTEHIREDLARVREEQKQKRQTLEQLSCQKQETERLMEQKNMQQNSCMEETAKLDETIQTLDQAVSEKTVLREQTTKEQQELFHKQEDLSEHISNLEKECYRLEHRKELLEDGLERKASYLWEEYELTPSEAEAFRLPEVPDRNLLKESIRQLKSQIRALGSINTNAVEEYAELSERLEFMRSQHDDLVHAKENLLLLIDQLDEGMRKQFAEKFQDIQKEFDKVFKELFGGGNGSLELSETEEMLEAGILINVQPPGKKLQNMMQLSGGEKALTAISLLFAIQNLKPSPFCILDEIEAALDDANVDRFAAYLNKLKKNTQFIVITHRRGTMLISDQLYGITMQEKGISSLVSVDLTDAEE
ncbi:MAG: chromosome segregation protein SMC [Lachnospiraceae bacterium]|nr:chromosome segregation protein SMC [Lachnospiraceae bacterium]